MRTMKSVPGVFLLLIVCSASAFATSTRDQGLGLSENAWVMDGLQTYLDENSSYLGLYKDRAYAERTDVTGVTEGLNRGGIFYAPTNGVTIGINFGQPVDNNLWNTTDREGLFHASSYSVKGYNSRSHSENVTTPIALGSYKVEMLDGNVIDLMDPVDASALKTSSATTSPVLREQMNQKNINLLGSYDFSRWSVGISGGYATSWNNKKTSNVTTLGTATDEYNLVNTQYNAGAGFRFKINDNLDLDGQLSWVMYDLDNKYTKKNYGASTKMSYSSDGSMDLSTSFRLGIKIGQTHKMHVYTGYQNLNRSTKGKLVISDPAYSIYDVNAKDSFSRKGQLVRLGVSDEIALNDSTKVFAGVGFNLTMFKNAYSGKDLIDPANNADKYSYEWKKIEIPFTIGLESKLSENWVGRFGLSQTIYKPFGDKGSNKIDGTKTPVEIEENSSSASTLTIGLTYKIGNFSFDWLASVDMFVTGPYAVSGKSYSDTDKTPMSTSFAASYMFNTGAATTGVQ
jgi:hypothetical protein